GLHWRTDPALGSRLWHPWPAYVHFSTTVPVGPAPGQCARAQPLTGPQSGPNPTTVPNAVVKPALIAHGGAGGRAPVSDRLARQRGLVAAVERGCSILREGGSATEAVASTVAALEDHSLFNAGLGSVLTLEGRVEMDAGIMVAV